MNQYTPCVCVWIFGCHFRMLIQGESFQNVTIILTYTCKICRSNQSDITKNELFIFHFYIWLYIISHQGDAHGMCPTDDMFFDGKQILCFSKPISRIYRRVEGRRAESRRRMIPSGREAHSSVSTSSSHQHQAAIMTTSRGSVRSKEREGWSMFQWHGDSARVPRHSSCGWSLAPRSWISIPLSFCPYSYISIARISMEHIFPKPKRYFWFDLLSVQSI